MSWLLPLCFSWADTSIFDVGQASDHPFAELTDWPEPPTMWATFVNSERGMGRPFLYRGVAGNWTGFATFQSDAALLQRWGSVQLDIVETEHKETRTAEQLDTSMHEFLAQYKNTEWYSVATMTAEMMHEVALPTFFQCGGMDVHLHGAVLWQSNGGTKSVIHSDSQDGLNCQLDGTKRWILWHPRYKNDIQSDVYGWVSADDQPSFLPPWTNNTKPNPIYGAFAGQIDVDNVDIKRFPGWAKLEHHIVDMHPGDCLFIPRGWFHHVASPPNRRSASTLVWWYRPQQFKPSECGGWAHARVPQSQTLGDCTWGFTPGENEKRTSCATHYDTRDDSDFDSDFGEL
jgi:hypothetical protein